MTVEEAIALQKDLIEGFKAEDFQAKLKEISRGLATGQINERKFNVERTKLFLSVQKEVLPRFGFHPSQKGVFDMMNVFNTKGFDNNEEFAQNGWFLTQLLFPPEAQQAQQAPPAQTPAQSSSSRSRNSDGARKLMVTARSTDTADSQVHVDMLSSNTIWELKCKLIQKGVANAHYYVYLRQAEGGYFMEMQDSDLVEETVWAHDIWQEYLPGLLPEGQRLRPPGGTPSRPQPAPGGTGHWPAGSEMFFHLSTAGIFDVKINDWMVQSFKSMEKQEAEVWMAIPEEYRWGSVVWMLKTPFFTRCREDPKFCERCFSLPGYKAPIRFAREDPELIKVDKYELMSRWFVSDGMPWQPGGTGASAPAAQPSSAPPADEPVLISLVRLGDDDLVRWEIVIPKSSTVADLRRRIVEVYGLDEKASKQMRFAMQRGQQFVSMVDSEKIKRAMAVRGLDVEWPPPADPAVAGFTA